MTSSNWRWFPAAIMLALASVIAVNSFMIYSAYHSFPGAADTDGYDVGKMYDRVLAQASQQAALGWRVDAAADVNGRVVLRVVEHDGAVLGGASVEARAARPVGPPDTTSLSFDPVDGTLVGRETLERGQWDIQLAITRGNDRLTETKRIVVR